MVDLSSTFPALESTATQAQHSESKVRGDLRGSEGVRGGQRGGVQGARQEGCVSLGSLAPASFPQCGSDSDNEDIY